MEYRYCRYILCLAMLTFFCIPHLRSQKSKSRIDWMKLYKQYEKDGDAMRMLNFLHDNMTAHYTDNYFWQDSVLKMVAFNELDYKDFVTSLQAFENLKNTHGKLTALRTREIDIDNINNDIIRSNIDATYPFFSKYPDHILLDYLLPYRVCSEPVQDWRETYFKRFSTLIPITEEISLKETINRIIDYTANWFICTYNIEKRPDPIPFLGSLQLLHRQKGGCEDVANLMTFALRSLGIPCAVDVIPYWGTSTGGHVLNTAFDHQGQPIHFDALAQTDSLYEMIREPAKVFRLTYSENKDLIASKKPANEIPPNGLLRERCYIDVTDEYWKTRSLTFKIMKDTPEETIYANVFNGGKMKPVWYGIKKDSTVVINKLCEGVAYFPTHYINNKNILVGNPVAFSGDSIIKFDPSNEVHDIKLTELPGYLKYKDGKLYTLYYFKGKWIKHEKKRPGDKTTRLIFHKVPKNALLLLKCEESNNKERPFTIDDQGKRTWW
jgi:hypothetical protein